MAKRSEDKARDQRVLVKDGFRSYRRTYRMSEVYWGTGTGAALLGIVGWVGWKGAHPDPSLFDMSAALSGGSATSEGLLAAPANARAPELRATKAPAPEAEGPFPAELASSTFRRGRVGTFSSDDLYVKINGRAGFFQSFGVKSLHAVTLESDPSSEAAGASVDIELYDLAESKNAIGAYNGERPPEIETVAEAGSSYHLDRNAGFLARGQYYVRFIGSDESELVKSEVRRLLDLFQRALPAAELPWAYALFVDQLKFSAGQVTYVKSNAFSFGFANDVFSVTLSPADARDDVEAFVSVAADEAAARALADQYEQGFLGLGAAAGKTKSGVALIKDEFLGTLSAATSAERWVVGIRGAPNPRDVEQMLERLSSGIAALPSDVRARAVPAILQESETSDEH